MSSLRSRPRSRGFTLVEILVAVVIVGILAAMATPSFVEKMRDRRASQVASDIALLYRTAKARAAGRGGAQMVRFTQSINPQGDFILMEGVQPDLQGNQGTGAANYAQFGSCGNLPLVGSCLTANWANAAASVNVGTTSRVVTQTPDRIAPNAVIFATFLAPGGAPLAQADMCFTPGGRTYFAAGGAPFTALASIPTVRVQRQTLSSGGAPVGILRTVLLPPNGAARQIL